MERQGLAGDLQSKSKEQLREILSRQEKLLNNKWVTAQCLQFNLYKQISQGFSLLIRITSLI